MCNFGGSADFKKLRIPSAAAVQFDQVALAHDGVKPMEPNSFCFLFCNSFQPRLINFESFNTIQRGKSLLPSPPGIESTLGAQHFHI